MEFQHRVWLARFGRSHVDPLAFDWDGYAPGLCLPATWRSSPLSTIGFGGSFAAGALRPTGPVADEELAWGPLPGDRVVAYRRASQDVVGVWLVSGARYGRNGEARYGVRPLVSCLRPVSLADGRRHDADLEQAWEATFGRGASHRGALISLDGPALAGVMRSVGLDPRLLCGPLEGLADCSLSNRLPGAGFRPAMRLQTALSRSRRMEERGLAEAVDWFLSGSVPGVAANDTATRALLDVETVGVADQPGVHLVARSGDGGVHQAMSIAVAGTSLDDLELCPTVVHEAIDAVECGRRWSLFVTLDALGVGRTIRLDAPAVAVCFDAQSGRVANQTDGP